MQKHYMFSGFCHSMDGQTLLTTVETVGKLRLGYTQDLNVQNHWKRDILVE